MERKIRSLTFIVNELFYFFNLKNNLINKIVKKEYKKVPLMNLFFFLHGKPSRLYKYKYSYKKWIRFN